MLPLLNPDPNPYVNASYPASKGKVAEAQYLTNAFLTITLSMTLICMMCVISTNTYIHSVSGDLNRRSEFSKGEPLNYKEENMSAFITHKLTPTCHHSTQQANKVQHLCMLECKYYPEPRPLIVPIHIGT